MENDREPIYQQFHMLRVRSHFDAAHRLDGYNGPCANLHGHRWEVLCSFVVGSSDSVGIAVDFKELKKLLADVLPDHLFLNDWIAEKNWTGNPTAETLIRVIAIEIERAILNKFKGVDVRLSRIELWESPDCSVVLARPRFE